MRFPIVSSMPRALTISRRCALKNTRRAVFQARKQGALIPHVSVNTVAALRYNESSKTTLKSCAQIVKSSHLCDQAPCRVFQMWVRSFLASSHPFMPGISMPKRSGFGELPGYENKNVYNYGYSRTLSNAPDREAQSRAMCLMYPLSRSRPRCRRRS